MKMKVPPGGFAALGQQTPVVQQLVAQAMGTRRTTTRRKKKKTTARRTTARRKPAKRTARRRTTRAKKPAYMVKGSAAAKRRMAQLRKMRKR